MTDTSPGGRTAESASTGNDEMDSDIKKRNKTDAAFSYLLDSSLSHPQVYTNGQSDYVCMCVVASVFVFRHPVSDKKILTKEVQHVLMLGSRESSLLR